MGVKVWKEVLLPGRQRDRSGEWFAFAPRDIRQAHRNFSKMLSRGVPLPAVWEHVDVEAGDDDDRRAAYARHTFAHIAGSRINARGALEMLHDIPDPADARQFAKTRYVSPKVYRSYSDSRGGEYRGTTIAHVAATPTPVQFWQTPVELSRGEALYLSYTPEGPAVADENDVDKGGGAEPGGDAGYLKKIIDALRAKGLTISDSVTDWAGLLIAVESNGDDPGDADLGLDDDADVGAGASPPVMMSDARATPLKKMFRRDLETRIRSLFATGRIARPTAKKLLTEASAVEMSVTRGGELAPNPVLAKVEAYEDLPKHAAWKPTGAAARELSVAEVDNPKDYANPDPAEATAWLTAPLKAK